MKSTRLEAFVERSIFKHRPLVLLLMGFVTLFLAYHAMNLEPIAGFEKMIPTQHQYIKD